MTSLQNECAVSEKDMIKHMNKNNLSSLVFSFDATLHGLIDINTISDSKILNDHPASWVILHKNLLTFENSPIYVARTNPSKPTFVIEKIKSKTQDNIYINIKFESLKSFSTFVVSGDENGTYFCLHLTPQNSEKTFIVILSLTDAEIVNKIIRNMLFCHADYYRCESLEPPAIVVDTSNYIYTGVNFIVKPNIYENEASGDIVPVPRENQVYKLRQNISKSIELIFLPLRNYEFVVERCFGALYSTEGNDPNKMLPFDDFKFEPFNHANDDQREGYRLFVNIPLSSAAYDIFNIHEDESRVVVGKDKISILCGVDIILTNISSPVRLLIELKTKLFGEYEKFWIKGRAKIERNFTMILKRNIDESNYDMHLVKILEFDPKAKMRMSQIDPTIRYNKESLSDAPEDSPDINETPDVILSGTFQFEPEIPPDIVTEWNLVICRWKETEEMPMNLQRLLKYGIPAELRREVWSMLVGLHHGADIEKHKYDELVARESGFERVILRDITRTFTCHQYFKHPESEGQQQLYRVCKAYSNYDEEVGYCQGMSFIIANFLLHFDELNAFCILEKVMYKMGHRNLFRQSFDELQCYIYILKRLLYSHIPELAKHFNDISLEVQMFVPQWFLTLFTSKFPLGMVDLAMDMFFSQGKHAIISISIAMLKICFDDLINLNFENTLKYLCNGFPKRFSTPSNAKQLFQLAYSINFPPSSFEQLQIEFDGHKRELVSTLDPVELKRIENRILIDCQMRLEQENNILAHDLIQIKIQMGQEIMELKELNHSLQKQIPRLLEELELSNSILNEVKSQEEILKQQIRKLMIDHEASSATKENIIQEYKKVCANLEKHQQEVKSETEKRIRDITKICQNCESCSIILNNTVLVDHDNNNGLSSSENNKKKTDDRVYKLEMELAFTKLNLAQSETENDQLTRKISDLQRAKSKKWFAI